MTEIYTNGNGEKISDRNVSRYGEKIIPSELKDLVKMSPQSEKLVKSSRHLLRDIYDMKDKRRIVMTGPCSVHDIDSALEYAHNLRELNNEKEVRENLMLVMRVYFEKPRTTVGWKGLINDPSMDGSYKIREGYMAARNLLSRITEIGVPCATEFLEVFTPQYIGEFFSWAAIGARTIESQCHRVMVSGLSSIVGLKNSTSGSKKAAVDAQVVALQRGVFLGIDNDGVSCPVPTNGNPYTCVVLRGSDKGPNYDPLDILETFEMQKKSNVRQGLIVDCSHEQIRYENGKQPLKQIEVAKKVLESMKLEPRIFGIMIESNIVEGNQPEPKTPEDILKLVYGKSITDPCIGWNDTKNLILEYASELARR
jgi:3-deoxy-7-phosphoheptulonate synthase